MNNRLASVYGLKDTRNGDIFYVGMSIDPYARYGEHLAFRVAKNAKESRILDMRREGIIPELIIFEKNIYLKDAFKREAYWIEYHLDLGMPLTNKTNLPKKNKPREPKSILNKLTESPKQKKDQSKQARFANLKINTFQTAFEHPDKWIPRYKVDRILWPIKNQIAPACVQKIGYKKSVRRIRDKSGALYYHKGDVLKYREELIQNGELPPTVKRNRAGK